MSDLISREDAIDALSMMQGIVAENGVRKGISMAWQQIADLPSAQPERKRGKWINYKDEHCCSVCDWVIIEECWDEENRYDYCPYCGADMRGEEDEF